MDNLEEKIKEEASKIIRGIFTFAFSREYEKNLLKEYKRQSKILGIKANKKPYNQILVFMAITHISCEDMEIEEMAGLMFPNKKQAYSLEQVYRRLIENREFFESEHDEDGFPKSYRLHKNGRFARRDKKGRLHVLESGIVKGDYIGHETISRWLKENR